LLIWNQDRRVLGFGVTEISDQCAGAD